MNSPLKEDVKNEVNINSKINEKVIIAKISIFIKNNLNMKIKYKIP